MATEVIDWGEKDPDEVIKYAIDMAPALADGDSLATVDYAFITQAGLTKSAATVDGTKARVTLSGGTHGLNGRLECTALTTGGETLQEIAKLKVRNKA